MKLRSIIMISTALGLGVFATAALAQQRTPTVKSEAAEKAEDKDAPMKTDDKTEAELKKDREAAAKSRKDTANARAAVRNAKQGKELEEEPIPQQ